MVVGQKLVNHERRCFDVGSRDSTGRSICICAAPAAVSILLLLVVQVFLLLFFVYIL